MSKEERGIQAKSLMDGLFAEWVAKAEAEYIDRWRNAKTLQEREEMHARILAIDSFRADMTQIIVTGDIAAKEAERQNDLRTR